MEEEQEGSNTDEENPSNTRMEQNDNSDVRSSNEVIELHEPEVMKVIHVDEFKEPNGWSW